MFGKDRVQNRDVEAPAADLGRGHDLPGGAGHVDRRRDARPDRHGVARKTRRKVQVRVDDAGLKHQPLGLEFLPGGPRDHGFDEGDAAVLNGHVRNALRALFRIDDGGRANDEIEHDAFSSGLRPG